VIFRGFEKARERLPGGRVKQIWCESRADGYSPDEREELDRSGKTDLKIECGAIFSGTLLLTP